MSGLFGSTTIKGTRITDFAKTSADVGNTIPFLYGRAPVTGNVIFAALPPKENRQVKRQGKGGVKQETFTYTTSYAISFCRGPIQGYWWIKRNGKVVYSQDPAAPIEDKDYAAKWAAKVMMYNGTSGQLPNSMIESYKGSGRVSAFKYLAYIAIPNEDVTEGGGAIPSYEAVPIASPQEVWITSTPYAQIFYDNARAGLAPTGGELVQLLYDADMQQDDVAVSFGPTGGELKIPPPGFFLDSADVSFGPTGGTLKVPPPQNFYDSAKAAFAPTGGSLVVPPVGTTHADNVTVGFGPTGGALFGSEWAMTWVATSNTTSNGWDGYTLRQYIPASATVAADKLKLTLTAGSSRGFTIVDAFIALSSATGDWWDYDGAPVRVKFGGSNGVTVAAGESVVTDEIHLAVLEDSNLVLGVYFSSGDVFAASDHSQFTKVEKSGNDAATVDTAGYGAQQSNRATLVSKIECHLAE